MRVIGLIRGSPGRCDPQKFFLEAEIQRTAFAGVIIGMIIYIEHERKHGVMKL